MRHRPEISGMILLADLRRLPEHRAVLGGRFGLRRRDRRAADRRRCRGWRVSRSGRTGFDSVIEYSVSQAAHFRRYCT